MSAAANEERQREIHMKMVVIFLIIISNTSRFSSKQFKTFRKCFSLTEMIWNTNTETIENTNVEHNFLNQRQLWIQKIPMTKTCSSWIIFIMVSSQWYGTSAQWYWEEYLSQRMLNNNDKIVKITPVILGSWKPQFSLD